jgi:hypothetical protein
LGKPDKCEPATNKLDELLELLFDIIINQRRTHKLDVIYLRAYAISVVIH